MQDDLPEAGKIVFAIFGLTYQKEGGKKKKKKENGGGRSSEKKKKRKPKGDHLSVRVFGKKRKGKERKKGKKRSVRRDWRRP